MVEMVIVHLTLLKLLCCLTRCHSQSLSSLQCKNIAYRLSSWQQIPYQVWEEFIAKKLSNIFIYCKLGCMLSIH